MQYQALLKQHPIISDQISRESLAVVLRELEQVLRQGIEGAVAEFGCYIGTTSLFIRRLLDTYKATDKAFDVYDSFIGLPSKTKHDMSGAGEQFRGGELSISKKQFLQQFQKAGIQPPRVHKGWFRDLAPQDVAPQLAYAFLDGDFYESIYESLQLVWPRLQPGGIITVDDYGREALPGVERAVTACLRGIPHTIRVEQGIAIISATIKS